MLASNSTLCLPWVGPLGKQKRIKSLNPKPFSPPKKNWWRFSMHRCVRLSVAGCVHHKHVYIVKITHFTSHEGFEVVFSTFSSDSVQEGGELHFSHCRSERIHGKNGFSARKKTVGVCWSFFVVGGFVCQVLQDFCLFWVWVCIDVQIGNLRPLVERSRKIRACRWPPGSYLPIDKPSFETPQTGTTDATEATTNLPMILKSTLRRRFYILFWKHIFVAAKFCGKIPSLLDFWFKKILPKKLLQKTHLQEGRCHQCVCHPSSTWKSL